MDPEYRVGHGNFPKALQHLAQDWMPDLVVSGRQARALGQGPWDLLTLNVPQAPWLERLLAPFMSLKETYADALPRRA